MEKNTADTVLLTSTPAEFSSTVYRTRYCIVTQSKTFCFHYYNFFLGFKNVFRESKEPTVVQNPSLKQILKRNFSQERDKSELSGYSCNELGHLSVWCSKIKKICQKYGLSYYERPRKSGEHVSLNFSRVLVSCLHHGIVAKSLCINSRPC